MKKLLIVLVLVLGCQCGVYANSTLDKIENSLYGFTYSDDTDSVRLNRIEEKVYGKKSTGAEKNRIAKLKKDLNVDLMGQEIEPREDSFMTDDDFIVYEKEPPEASKMDYPAIDELEKQVFKKEFKNENIKTRLSKLEKETFKKTYDNDDLSKRVDRLKAQLKPQSFKKNGMHQQENVFYTSESDRMARNYHLDQYGSPFFDYDSYNSHNSYDDDPVSLPKNVKPLNLSKIEKQIYHKKFENEPVSNRLTRIETSVFGTSFPNDSESERMQRLSSAIQAQKSAKRYDSNRFSQHVATAVQIGTLILMVLACIL